VQFRVLAQGVGKQAALKLDGSIGRLVTLDPKSRLVSVNNLAPGGSNSGELFGRLVNL